MEEITYAGNAYYTRAEAEAAMRAASPQNALLTQVKPMGRRLGTVTFSCISSRIAERMAPMARSCSRGGPRHSSAETAVLVSRTRRTQALSMLCRS